MSSNDIISVFPTPMAKQLMKTRLKVAEKGHNILKRKAEVLEMRFRRVGKEIVKIKSVMGDIFKEASFMFAEAKFVSGDFNDTVLNGVKNARFKVKHRTENVAGVELFVFQSYTEGADVFCLTGLSKGGFKLTNLKQTYVSAAEILVELATLQSTFLLLDDVIKSLNRRVNALEHVYIPKVERTIKYIDDEMDEQERQNFFRMKKIQNLKKNIMKQKEREKRELEEGRERENLSDTSKNSNEARRDKSTEGKNADEYRDNKSSDLLVLG